MLRADWLRWKSCAPGKGGNCVAVAYDALVIGGGHNGLVAAGYLAKAGLRVLVVERRPVLGGAASSEPLFPGFQVDCGAYNGASFLRRIVQDLRLKSFGLEFIDAPVAAHLVGLDSPSLTLWRDLSQCRASIARHSPADADQYPAFIQQMASLTTVLRETMTLAPPQLPHLEVGELASWLRVAVKARRLGERRMMDFLRVLPMPVADYLDEWFESGLLKAAIASLGVVGRPLGPRAPGTALALLYQACSDWETGLPGVRQVRGGMGQLGAALAAAARRCGAQLRTGAGVERILLEGDRATGILLEGGEQVKAKAILSNVDPRRTFFDLVGAEYLPVSFVREVKNIRFRSAVLRVNLALDGLPDFSPGHSMQADAPASLSGRILVCPDLDYLERAADDAKYGRFSERPYVEAFIPTLLDPSLAPPGKHLMIVSAQYAPYHLVESDWDACREAAANRLVSLLSEYAPGLDQFILYRHVLTPLDLERQYSLPEGDIFHGQMDLDQLLFMRPVPGYSQYSTPIANLYLCGAGTHPGGGVTGAPGYNAARRVLKQFPGG